MQDRVPLYPGRVSLTPVSGNIYDMTMADQPQVVGTPLNKANLLSDAAAAAVWPVSADRPGDPTVSEALAQLGGKQSMLLAHYTTHGTSANRETEVFSLAAPIELFNSFEVWGWFPTQPDSTPLQLFIDVGNKTQITSSQASDYSERLSTIVWSGGGTVNPHHYIGLTKTLLLENTASGHTAIFRPILDTSSNNYGEVGSSANQLTGTSVYLFVASGSSNRVLAGAHIAIIGHKF